MIYPSPTKTPDHYQADHSANPMDTGPLNSTREEMEHEGIEQIVIENETEAPEPHHHESDEDTMNSNTGNKQPESED